LSDPQGAWVKAARLDWDATSIMGNNRGKRFVAVIDVYDPFGKIILTFLGWRRIGYLHRAR